MVEQTMARDNGTQQLGMLPSCAVLVCSCDAYSDLWAPFFHLFWRYWPDCPFPVYLGSGELTCEIPNVRTLHSPDANWTSSLRFYLNQIGSEYVLVLLEDFFLEHSVDSAQIVSHLETLHGLGGVVIRLTPKPGPDSPLLSHPGVGRLDTKAPYRVSLQAAIWNRRHLLALLSDGESAWEFEWNGTERSRVVRAPFLATEKPAFRYRHVVERGKWFWSAARKYRREAIACDFTARPVMNPLTAAKKALNRMRKNALDTLARRRRHGMTT